jgi:hypothetical protein
VTQHSNHDPAPLFDPGDQSLRPRALTIVAWLFISTGTVALLLLARDLLSGRNLRPNAGVIDLALGLALLRGKRGVLPWAKGWLVLTGTLLVVACAIVAFTVNTRELGPLAFRPGLQMLLVLGGLLSALRLAVTVWEYRVLERPEVEALFESVSPPAQRRVMAHHLEDKN